MGISDKYKNDAMANRDFAKNPPQHQPGMSGINWDEVLSSDTGDTLSDGFGGDVFHSTGGADGDLGSALSNLQGTSGDNVLNYAGLNGQQGRNFEDVVYDGVAVAGKHGWSAMKEFIESLAEFSALEKARFGRMNVKVGAGMIAFSVLLWILGIFVKVNHAFDIFLSGLCVVGTGVAFLGLNIDKAKEEIGEVPNEEIDELEEADFNFDEEGDEDTSWGDSSDDDIDDSWGDIDDDSSDSGWGDLDGDSSWGDDIEEDTVVDNPDLDDEYGKLKDLPAHQYTRRFLFDTFMGVLPKVNPNYGKMVKIEEWQDKFEKIQGNLSKVAEDIGMKNAEDLFVEEIRENKSIIQVRCNRPVGLKPKELADGLAQAFKVDEFGIVREGAEGVYATYSLVTGGFVVNIFKGEPYTVSLKDLYMSQENWVCDTDNKMPVFWGISEYGIPWKFDLWKTNAMLISGAPRGGKSWKGQSLIAQICMFKSPKEVQFRVYDVKGPTSDYYKLSQVLPHFKSFVSDAYEIVRHLRQVLDEETKKRNSIFKNEGEGAANYDDFRKICPDYELPILYIVIDEVVTLVSTLDKDTKAEYDRIINELVTKTPNLGIKLIMFPHRLTQEIIKKTQRDLCGLKVVVKMPFESVNEVRAVKRDEFPYNLVTAGDMAVCAFELNKGNPVYSHAEVITNSNEDNVKLFKYIGKVWGMLEPECKTLQEKAEESKMNIKDNTVEKVESVGKWGTPVKEEVSSISGIGDDLDDESWWDDIIK